MIDAAVQNEWQMHRTLGSKFTALNFRRELANFYLRTYGCPPIGIGRPSLSPPSSSPKFRLDGKDHLIIQNEGNKRRRCAKRDMNVISPHKLQQV